MTVELPKAAARCTSIAGNGLNPRRHPQPPPDPQAAPQPATGPLPQTSPDRSQKRVRAARGRDLTETVCRTKEAQGLPVSCSQLQEFPLVIIGKHCLMPSALQGHSAHAPPGKASVMACAGPSVAAGPLRNAALRSAPDRGIRLAQGASLFFTWPRNCEGPGEEKNAVIRKGKS